MKIKAVDTHLLMIEGRKLLFVRIHTSTGISGVGECTATYGAGATAIEAAVKEFSNFVMGENPAHIERLCDKIRFNSFWGMSGGPYVCSAIAGIEQALWDIKGKILNAPVYELLGGCVRERIRVYANTWNAVGWDKPKDFVAFAEKAMTDGFTALKIYPFGIEKIVQDDQKVVERVQAVRKAVGDDVDLMVDGGWRYCRNTAAAIEIGKRLEEYNLRFWEEPIGPDNIRAMAEVAKNVKIPLAAGERIYTPNAFRDYLENGALGFVQADVGLAGGILELKKIAVLAESFQAPFAPHNCSGPVATAATVQFAATDPNFFILESFPYQTEWQKPVLTPLDKTIKDGYLSIPETPGLGITLNEKLFC